MKVSALFEYTIEFIFLLNGSKLIASVYLAYAYEYLAFFTN